MKRFDKTTENNRVSLVRAKNTIAQRKKNGETLSDEDIQRIVYALKDTNSQIQALLKLSVETLNMLNVKFNDEGNTGFAEITADLMADMRVAGGGRILEYVYNVLDLLLGEKNALDPEDCLNTRSL